MESLKKDELINWLNNEKQSSNELQEPQKLIQNLAEKEVLDKQKERQQEKDRIKTIIRFEDILARIDSNVRQDFLKGTKGAIVRIFNFLSLICFNYWIILEIIWKRIDSIGQTL